MVRNMRTIKQIVSGQKTSDGAGVVLYRSLGVRDNDRLDPFLMLDEFGTENPDDYIAGFPAHPHRGFETVTYMIEGHMRHQDHLGNIGELTSGSVQWMTAGRGIVHSEMPMQNDGRMRGFQLWLNLPAAEKMKPASYRDIAADEIPVVKLDSGGSLKLIAGRLWLDEKEWRGPINSHPNTMVTDPLFLDLTLPPGARCAVPLPPEHNALIYPYEGIALIGDQTLLPRQAGVLSAGNEFEVQAGAADSLRMILLAGKPLKEPVVQYGPFVMNTQAEIEQALADYRAGTLADKT